MTTLDKVYQAVLGSVISVILAVAILALLAFAARGQEFGDFGVGHHEYHHWYNNGEKRADGSWGPIMRPDVPQSKCCEDDCRPAKSKYDDGSWWVYIDRGWERV